MEYEPVIGMEIHVELKTKSKMFCACDNYSEKAKPNENVCPVCLAEPGTLPVANKQAIEFTLMAGMALNCQAALFSKFDRKNYFYPDLPKGYQISQYDLPFTYDGFIEIEGKKIGIRRIHLEEDTGKLVHPKGADYSLVDLNRAGTPLIELVTEPDIKTAEEAKKFCQEYQLILRYLGISNADMEKGEMRCEANISLRPKGEKEFGTLVEIKNLNSFRSVFRAIEFEIKRQSEVLDRGEKVKRETRGWDENKGQTFSQRSKELAHEYRYFPEPDIPPFNFQTDFAQINLKKVRERLPELPVERRAKLLAMGIVSKDIEVLVSNKGLGDYFEEVLKHFKENPKLLANWVINEGLDSQVPPEEGARLLEKLERGQLSGKMGKEVLSKLKETKGKTEDILKELGIQRIADEDQIIEIVQTVIRENPKPVEDYRRGKKESLGFLIGQVMRQTRGQADPGMVNKVLIKLLG